MTSLEQTSTQRQTENRDGDGGWGGWHATQDTARISTIIDKQHKKEAARKDSGRDLTSMAAANRGNFNALSSKFKAAGKLIQVRFG